MCIITWHYISIRIEQNKRNRKFNSRGKCWRTRGRKRIPRKKTMTSFPHIFLYIFLLSQWKTKKILSTHWVFLSPMLSSTVPFARAVCLRVCVCIFSSLVINIREIFYYFLFCLFIFSFWFFPHSEKIRKIISNVHAYVYWYNTHQKDSYPKTRRNE